jgi:hypothetical protein
MAALDCSSTLTLSPISQFSINGVRKGLSQPRNPVFLRLYKVLSTNFDDEDTRQALGTLSDLYATPKGKDMPTVEKELNDKVMNDSVDASYVPTTLAESIPGESAMIPLTKARKYLWRAMENRLTEGSRKFLGEVVTFPPNLIIY